MYAALVPKVSVSDKKCFDINVKNCTWRNKIWPHGLQLKWLQSLQHIFVCFDFDTDTSYCTIMCQLAKKPQTHRHRAKNPNQWQTPSKPAPTVHNDCCLVHPVLSNQQLLEAHRVVLKCSNAPPTHPYYGQGEIIKFHIVQTACCSCYSMGKCPQKSNLRSPTFNIVRQMQNFKVNFLLLDQIPL